MSLTKYLNDCKNIPEAFKNKILQDPDRTLWSLPIISENSVSWDYKKCQDVLNQVLSLSKYLQSKNLPYVSIDKASFIPIISNTRPEWCIADLGILGAGLVTVSIYPTLTSKDISFIIWESESKIVFAENQEQVDKIVYACNNFIEVPSPNGKENLKIKPNIELIITFEKVVSEINSININEIFGNDEFKAQYKDLKDIVFPLTNINRDDIASIVYTSGTTGIPKGVIQTHGNHLTNVRQALESGIFGTDGTLFLYLPLAHSFARLVYYVNALTESKVEFPPVSSKNNSKIELSQVMQVIRNSHSNYLPSVPRLFEKVKATLEANSNKKGLSAYLLRLCINNSKIVYEKKINNQAPGVFNTILFNALETIRIKIKHNIFGKEFLHAISGGAKLPADVNTFFESLGIEIYEGYGLTETCVATNVNRVGHKKIGSVGQTFSDIDIKIAEDGEIYFRGPNITKAYYKREKENAECWDSEGFFHTGDIGYLDEEGYLFITDRKKELIVTAGGKKIAPLKIESELKRESLISNLVIVGDGYPFLTALFTINEEVKKNYKDIQTPYNTSENLRYVLQKNVDTINAELSSFEQIKKFYILDDDFTIENGLLTPTLKTRRKEVIKRFKNEIAIMYG